VSNVTDIDGVRRKIKATCMSKYGVGSYVESDEFKVKQAAVCHPMKNPQIAARAAMNRKKACMHRYGVAHESQRHIAPDKLAIFHDDSRFNEVCGRLVYTKDIAEYMGYTVSPIAARMAELGISHPTNTSKGESEVISFVKSLICDDGIVLGDRTILDGRELDIYLPSYNVAIEYNGLYWHSEKFKDKYYHQTKSLDCMEKGIQLIHVWEDDWANREEVVKRKIRAKLLGIEKKRVFARKCTIVSPHVDDVKVIYDEHHIQGFRSATVHLGLEHNGVLLACMSLKRTKDDMWDLTRFASNVQVVGGFSKLLANFKKLYQWTEIFTFASLDYSHGTVYEKTGFSFDYITSPNYIYHDGYRILTRYQTMKHKLQAIVTLFDESITEKENMTNNGFVRVYDSGSIKYSLKKNPSD